MKKRIFFPDLDLLRTIACMFVLVAHIAWDGLEKLYPEIAENRFLAFFFVNGGLGVQIFFMLSGFLITYLLLQEKTSMGFINIKNFYIRRILRIWPLYFLVVGFVFIVYPALKHFANLTGSSAENPLFYIFFIGNFDVIRILGSPNASLNSMSAITWSVAIEEQFYLFWPLLFMLFSSKKVVGAMSIILLLSSTFILFNNLNGLQVYYHTFSNFLFLSTGGVLAWLYTYHNTLLQKLITGGNKARYFILAALLLVLIYAKDHMLFTRLGFLSYWILTAVSIGWFILQLLFDPNSYAKSNEHSRWVIAGKYTYGLYMYHRIAQWSVNTAVDKFIHTEGLAVVLFKIALCFSAAIMMSVLSYKYFEKPALELKKRFALFVKN
ncbi:acyltransferase family protein [Taibaiella soli]|uniref:Acyltransferase 3 domain-containing protein n=1 Tax=Taibaiella soli TaxID=1649169 RepID=A0A2W2A9J2_9BACT|nr:acyltransferase [Taibaiella soli]PZF72035.1 hypothetical protein DN068_15480 [Taibaiella soli]